MDLQQRFYIAMGTYGVLAILAGVTLDGKMRLAVWIFLAGLALRTLIHMKAQE
jgi:predicted membrane channel-forming protein YqfA (hemolysin III family)